METSIIDAHTHVYPLLSYHLEHTKKLPLASDKIVSVTKKIESTFQPLKDQITKLANPIHKLLHHSSTLARKLPGPVKSAAELTSMPWMGAMSLLEFNTTDLINQMHENSVTQSVVIAHPPIIPNEFVVELAKADDRIIPVVNMCGELYPEEKFLQYISQGAKALKIHAASEGKDAKNEVYLKLLKIADENEIPVIIHTGCLHIKPIYKDPEMGHAKKFEAWFKEFKNTKFVLAHMNFHYPDHAISLAAKYDNVFLETSWQPEKIIAKATMKLGPDKIMYGSDWPILGGNMSMALGRIRNLHRDRIISDNDYEKITSITASRFFKL